MNKRIIYITNDERYIYYLTDKSFNKYDTETEVYEELYWDSRRVSYINNAVVLGS